MKEVKLHEAKTRLSAVPAWEVSFNHALGRLPLPEPPQRLVPTMREAHGIAPLPLTGDAVTLVGSLPVVHRGSFASMLVCQALADGLAILTPANALARYPVRTAWSPRRTPLQWERTCPREEPQASASAPIHAGGSSDAQVNIATASLRCDEGAEAPGMRRPRKKLSRGGVVP